MIDPRRYDDTERLAMTRVGNWRAISAFRPNFFETHGFPMRITELGELPYMLSALHDAHDAERNLRELRGLRPDELTILADAIRRFLSFHALYANRSRVQIPYTGFLYYYALLKKLRGFPEHAAILDIGGGLGLLPFLFGPHFRPTTYNQIEVTQSLYILQSAINSYMFLDRFRDLAMEGLDRDGFLQWSDVPRPTLEPSTIDFEFDTDPACSLFPWWRLPAAFEDQYDLIMCNENICEMDRSAFAYFARKSAESLKPNGALFIHGIGKTAGDRTGIVRERFEMLAACGFRSIVFVSSFEHEGWLARPNFILIGPRHERYGDTENRIYRRFDADDPMLRAIYGLDEPDGAVTDLATLSAELKNLIGAGRPPEL